MLRPETTVSSKDQGRAYLALTCVVAIASASVPRAASATDWPQWGFDARHSSNNTAETTVNRDNVARLTLKYRLPVVAPLATDAPPVYASAIETPTGTKDLLFVNATDGGGDFSSTTGSLIAIDAADASIVWVQTTSGSSAHAASSPAIDPGRAYVYAYGLDGYVHKYAIGDGAETITQGPVGWPALVTLKPDVEKVAGGLTIVESGGAAYLVAITDAYNGDGGDYQGHVVTIDLATGAQHVFNAICSDIPTHLTYGTCADVGGGIWGRGGATFDAATNRLYVATGNGHFDANAGGHNWGDSVLALAADGSSVDGLPLDSFTPTDYDGLDAGDEDLGLTSLAILPAPAGSTVTHLGLQIGKSGTGYLIDLDAMSGSGVPGGVGGELQGISTGGGTMSQPTVWIDPDDGSTWVYIANSAWQLTLDGAGTPLLEFRWSEFFGGGLPILANGILYSGINALDPRTGDPLWLSGGGGSHWESPIVVDGAIYLADDKGYLSKWALPATHIVTPVVSDPAEGSIDPADPQSVFDGDVVRFTIAPIPPYEIEGVSGCGVSFDGSSWVTMPVYFDCAVTATFFVDAIFANGFDGS
jgi:hypothetical protein